MEILPCNDASPVYPFSGFVINLNVTTRIHRDWGDQDICLVLVIKDGIGGELCLMEPGIVLGLRNGDAVVFASSKISHFNLHFIGKRASLVFHSDASATSWVKDRNGWKHNVYFRTTDSNDVDSGL